MELINLKFYVELTKWNRMELTPCLDEGSEIPIL